MDQLLNQGFYLSNEKNILLLHLIPLSPHIGKSQHCKRKQWLRLKKILDSFSVNPFHFHCKKQLLHWNIKRSMFSENWFRFHHVACIKISLLKCEIKSHIWCFFFFHRWTNIGKYQGLFTMWCHFSIGKHTRNFYQSALSRSLFHSIYIKYGM